MAQNGGFSSYIAFLMIGMVITGAANTLLYKLQDKQIVLGQPFNHPFMQTLTMFLGELFCLFLYLGLKYKYPVKHEQTISKAVSQGLKIQGAAPWLLIPALSDFTTTTLQFFGLMMIDPSVYQMLRGGVIIVTALFSVLFLGRRISLNQTLGIFLAVIGITVVGTSAMLRNNENLEISSGALFGIIFVLLSLITNGLIFVSEEKIFSIYHLEPLELVGIEGCWGVLLCLIFIPVFNIMTLNPELPMGIMSGNERYIERVDVYFEQLANSGILIFACIAALFSIALFNFFGVSVTKNVSALARALLDVTRTIFVWGIGLMIPNPNGGYWEKFSLLQFIGFAILIFGTLTYNQIITIIQDPLEEISGKEPKKSDIGKKDDEEEDLLNGQRVSENSTNN